MRPLLVLLAGLLALAMGARAQAEKQWTYLAYMHADTDLESAMFDDTQEMLQGPAAANANLVMFIDRSKGCARRRRRLQGGGACSPDRYTEDMANFFKDGAPYPYTNGAVVALRKLNPETKQQYWEVLEDLGEQNFDAPETLSKFVTKYLKAYPAKQTALVLSDHGMSYTGFGGDEEGGNPENEWGEKVPLSLANIEVGVKNGLKGAGVEKFDLLGFDACLMSGVIVHNTLVPHSRYFLASAETEPGYGWDYSKFDLNAADAVALGKGIIDAFMAYDPENLFDYEKTLSLIDASKYPAYLKDFTRFVGVLDEAAEKKSKTVLKLVQRAVNNAWKYDGAGYGETKPHLDMGDFLGKVEKASETRCPRLSDAAKKLNAAYTGIQAYEKDNAKHPQVRGGAPPPLVF